MKGKATPLKCFQYGLINTKGAAGPSGIDTQGWRRLCTSFKSASHDLCRALASVAKRICTSLVDPKGCRLIALDKRPGVRPTGICETPRRIIAKAILFTTKGDIQYIAGPRQLCAGQIAGIEAAVHSTKSLFAMEDTEAVLLVDANKCGMPMMPQPQGNSRHSKPGGT